MCSSYRCKGVGILFDFNTFFTLDEKITTFYKSNGIYTPDHIDEREIARKLDIHLIYSDKRCYASKSEDFKLININKHLTRQQQRERFFHELGHIMMHTGCQYTHNSLRDHQEHDAANFTRYAAIPLHMLTFVDFNSPYLIENMAATFKVSKELCKERLNDVYLKNIVIEYQ